MSNHIHLILSAKPESSGLSFIIRDFKKYTSKAILARAINSKYESRRKWLKVVFEYHAKFNTNNSLYQFWQQGNKPMQLIKPRFFRQKLNYIHRNPIVAGIVTKEDDYFFSSARNYLNRSDIVLEIDLLDFGIEEGYFVY